MGISLEGYRAAIGTFHCCIRDEGSFFIPCAFSKCNDYDIFNVGKRNWSKHNHNFVMHAEQLKLCLLLKSYIGLPLAISLLLVLANDIELNPGPQIDGCNLSICHANVRSLKAKDRLLHIQSDLASVFDIITLSETWLSGDDISENFMLRNFQHPYRRDRDNDHGYGGLLCWVSNKIASKRRTDLEHPDIEVLWIEITLRTKKLYICTVYRPPNINAVFWDALQENIELVQQEYNGKIMFIGDFNADPNSANGIHLNNFCTVNGISKHIDQPTRITDKSSSILDQCLTNVPAIINKVEILPPISTCDHCVISILCNLRLSKQKSYKRVMWNFTENNFEQFRDALEIIDWQEITSGEDIDLIVDKWTLKFLETAKTTVVNKEVTVRPDDKGWYNGYLRRLNRKKKKCFENLKHNPTELNMNKFKNLRSLYQSELNRIKEEFENNKYSELANKGIKNSKKWWSLLKNVLKNSDIPNQIPPIEHDGKQISDDEEKANVFNEYFASISTLEGTYRLPDEPNIVMADTLEIFEITNRDITDQLNNLDVNKAYGIDGISPRLLKESGNTLCEVLKNIYNRSLQISKVPQNWKNANVIPIHKKESRSNVNNYRPISILSSVGKMFERIVFKYVHNFLLRNFILTAYQSGFQPGKSTVTQLIEVYHHFCKAVDSNKEMRVIFLDITKAFDKVWHKGIIYKLRKCGINGRLLLWFQDYLSNRMQRVVINGQHSNWKTIDAGVPQGSVLGPLLFLLYINDIVQSVRHCNIRLFADDTCIFIEVNDRHEAAAFLNADLSKIHEWSTKWLIKFAPTKTKSLIISNKKDFNQNPPVFLNNQIIEEVKSHTYLGVTFSRKLRWSEHINTVYFKAKKRLNLLLPLKFKLDRHSLEIMYRSFVAPVMEYAIQVWGGTYDSDINKLEQIHVDGMRLVTGATARSNIANLYKETAWQSFRERRDNQMLVMLYKVKNRHVPDYLIELLPPENHEQVQYNLRNNHNIALPYSRLESFRRSFIPYAINLWNSLNGDVRIALSITEFKNALKKDCDEACILYYYGKRWASVHHARMRLGCSKLKADLFYKLHVEDSPTCSCGYASEDAEHFFFHCPNFADARAILIDKISAITMPTLKTILYCNSALLLNQNQAILDATHEFITVTKRFN